MRRMANLVLAVAIAGVVLPNPAFAADDGLPTWVHGIFVYLVIVVVLIGAIYSILAIRTAVANTKWSLADALSEEAEITPRDANGNPIPPADPAKPEKVTVLAASSSRLIALVGTIAILFLFLGFGAFLLYDFAIDPNTVVPATVVVVIKFLAAGLTLFAPYVANKASGIFDSLK
jgi:hypothetical protein